MSKMNGRLADYAPMRQDGSQVTICYGLKAIDETRDLYEWHEIELARRQNALITLDTVKDAILGDINRRTDARILNGYAFTPDGADEPIIVWLSTENQHNYQEAQRLEVVPVTFKLNETPDKQPIYHTFETQQELDRFYKGGVAYVQQQLKVGWAEKDAVDWAPYEALFPQTEDDNQQ